MLPDPSSPDFPAALKAAREAAGLSRSELARRAQIHAVMPRRYEEPGCREFARPSSSTYWALNRALGFHAETAQPAAAEQDVALSEASIEQIVAELKQRGISATLSFPAV